MGIIKEFKKFALRGSVVDLAVGIIIGGGFNKIVSSLVEDVIMPPIGQLVGKVDFTNLFVTLGPGEYPTLSAAKEAGAATLNYGNFINNIISFTLTAFAVFLLVRSINRFREREEAKAQAPAQRPCPYCLTQVPAEARRCPACTSEIAPERA